MGLTEGHLLNDEGGAWEPIGGWPDKPNVSPYPQPVCCQSIFPKGMQNGCKYPRKEYLALLDVMYQAIDDYKGAVEESGPQRTKSSKNDALEKIEQQINFVSWMLAEISEVMDDEG